MLEYARDRFKGPTSSQPPPNPAGNAEPQPTNGQQNIHNTANTAELQPQKGQVELETENGVPIMPAVMDNRDLKKDYMVELVRKYLTAHYGEWQHPRNTERTYS
jgi:hypothetical protein